MTVTEARNQQEWDAFLGSQTFRPFLQSWTMGEVYRDTGQPPIRLEVREGNEIVGICQAILVPARRGRHLSIPYGPVLNYQLSTINYQLTLDSLIQELTKLARENRCSFIRMSPFWPSQYSNPHPSSLLAPARSFAEIIQPANSLPGSKAGCHGEAVGGDGQSPIPRAVPSPLHLLAEHLWYLPLVEPDPWKRNVLPDPPSSVAQTSIPPDPLPPRSGPEGPSGPRTAEEEEGELHEQSNNNKTQTFPSSTGGGARGGGCLSREGAVRAARRTEEQLLMAMRKTTRNLIRRAEKDGVTIEASQSPDTDIETFIALHEETRRRHGFTPYTDDFFRAQVQRFSERNECTLYLARYQNEVAAASIHMHAFGETSYHHGASTHRLSKVPASYLLQWTAIRDALRRGDRVYNFWGIAPVIGNRESELGRRASDQDTKLPRSPNPESRIPPSHPFAGVTLFKTGFGGSLLPLVHCMDFPLSARYHLTRVIELLRKWKRGF